MDELTLSYMAGFFDAEGTIRITRHLVDPKRRTKRSYANWELWVSMGHTNRASVEWFQSEFGGRIHVDTYDDKPNHNTLFTWIISCRTALSFIETILPYLILKTAEAELGIYFQRNLKTGRGGPISAELKAKQEECYWKMRELKTPEARAENLR